MVDINISEALPLHSWFSVRIHVENVPQEVGRRVGTIN